MDRRDEIVGLLLQATIRIQEALKHNDIEMVRNTMDKRQILLDEYNSIEGPPLEGNVQELADKMLAIDKENNDLLEKMVEKERQKLDSVKKEKNDVKKRTGVAKKYVSVGTSVGEYSRFNKKT